MPAILDAPEQVDSEDIETYDLTRDFPIEQPAARASHSGFWRMLPHGISKRVTHTPRAEDAPVHSNELHRFEASVDRIVREHPSLAPYAFAIL